MKLQPVTSNGALWGYSFHCPGCDDVHAIPTVGPGRPCWQFNGSLDAPTFSPSILRFEGKCEDGTIVIPRCHSFVRDGRIQFLSDCGHALAGQTVDLPEVAE